MPSIVIDTSSASKTITYRGKFSGDYIVRLGSADELVLDLSRVSASNLKALGVQSGRSGNDITLQFKNVKTEKVLSSVVIEGAALAGGLKQVSLAPPVATRLN